MKSALILILFCLSFSTYSQTELWTRKVSKGTYMTQLENGKLFLKDKSTITVVNHMSGKVEWKKEFSSKNDPQFFDDVPLVFFDGEPYAVMDASTGYIIDESSEKTEMLNISYFWKEGKIIVETKRKKNLHVLNIDLNDLSKSKNTNVGNVSRKIENNPMVTPDGSLIIVDKKFVAIIDSSGTNTDRIQFKKKLKFLDFNLEKNMLYVLEGGKTLHLIDIKNAKTNATFDFSKMDLQFNILGDGSTISVAQKNELRILDGVQGMQVGSQGFRYKINQVFVDEQSGRCFVMIKNELSEIDYTSGEIKQVFTFEKSFSDLYRVYDKNFLGGKYGVSPIDLETMTLEYNIPARIPEVHDYIEMGDYMGYIHQSGGDYTLHVVDNIGHVLWKESFFSEVPPSFDFVGDGLLLMSWRKVRYLDIATGNNLWGETVEVDPSFEYGIDEETQDLYMYSEKRLYRFDYSSGVLTRSKDKIKFDDFDYSLQKPQILVTGDAIFLKGSNTVFVTSKNGEVLHEKTYERISNGSTLLKIANVIATAALIGTATGRDVLSVYPENEVVTDVLFESWYRADYLDYVRRTRQNRASNAYPYVFTKVDKKNRGLIFLDPATGAERLFIVMDEKDPTYIIDNFDGLFFYLDDSKLRAFDIR